MYSFAIRDGQVLQETLVRYSVTADLAGEKVDWPGMNEHYRNKLLGRLRTQVDALPSEDTTHQLQAPGPLGSLEEYKRAD